MHTIAPKSSPSIRVRTLCCLGALTSVLLAGCSILPEPATDPTRYYLLEGGTASTDTISVGTEARRVGLRPVELPGYLRNNRTMVVRNGINEIQYQDFARWAEPLENAVQHGVREQLLISGGIAAVEISPSSGDLARDFEVTIRVFRCEGGDDGQGRKTARFEAAYEIADLRHKGEQAVRHYFRPSPADWNGSDFGQLATRLSDAVAALGNDIAANLPK